MDKRNFTIILVTSLCIAAIIFSVATFVLKLRNSNQPGTAAARATLEQIQRPELTVSPSGPERIEAHHKTLQVPDDELSELTTPE